MCECVCRLAAIGYSGEVEDVVNVMSFRWFNFIDVGKRALGTIVLIAHGSDGMTVLLGGVALYELPSSMLTM